MDYTKQNQKKEKATRSCWVWNHQRLCKDTRQIIQPIMPRITSIHPYTQLRLATLRLAIGISGYWCVYVVFNRKQKSGLYFVWGISDIFFLWTSISNTPNTHMQLQHPWEYKNIYWCASTWWHFLLTKCGWGQYVLLRHLASINPCFSQYVLFIDMLA